MIAKAKALYQNDFIRNNAVFFVGSMAVAVVNYLYYPILGRLLDTASFGEVQALISVFLQLTLLLTVITNVSVNIVANEKDTKVRNRTVLELERFSIVLFTVIVLIALLFIGPIKTFLQFEDGMPIFILGLALIATAATALRTAYLRGLSAYGRASLASLISSIAKLLFAVVFVLAGFSASGAIGGLVAAQLVSLVYVFLSARKLGLHGEPGDKFFRVPDFSLIKPQLPYAGLVLVVSLATTTLFSIDTILAKHYFDPHTAGLYAGVATIGRIIYFATGSIAVVLLSSVQISAKPDRNKKLLRNSALIQGGIGAVILAVFYVVPDFTIRLMIGADYLEYADLLPKIGLTLFLLSFVNLVCLYNLALRRWSIGVVAVLGVTLATVIVILHHDTPYEMVDSLLTGAVLLLLLQGINALRYKYHNRSKLPDSA